MKKLLTGLSLIVFMLGACDSNIEREDRTEERADSLSNVMENHTQELDEITSSLESKIEELNEKLDTDEKADI